MRSICEPVGSGSVAFGGKRDSPAERVESRFPVGSDPHVVYLSTARAKT
jgi:hypothetical protein